MQITNIVKNVIKSDVLLVSVNSSYALPGSHTVSVTLYNLFYLILLFIILLLSKFKNNKMYQLC